LVESELTIDINNFASSLSNGESQSQFEIVDYHHQILAPLIVPQSKVTASYNVVRGQCPPYIPMANNSYTEFFQKEMD
jgi:hypothetical protein